MSWHMLVIAGGSPLKSVCVFYVRRYFDTASATFEASVGNPPDSLGVQMSKMAVGLLSGKYSEPPKEENPATVKGVESDDKMEVSASSRTGSVEETQRPAVQVGG